MKWWQGERPGLLLLLQKVTQGVKIKREYCSAWVWILTSTTSEILNLWASKSSLLSLKDLFLAQNLKPNYFLSMLKINLKWLLVKLCLHRVLTSLRTNAENNYSSQELKRPMDLTEAISLPLNKLISTLVEEICMKP